MVPLQVQALLMGAAAALVVSGLVILAVGYYTRPLLDEPGPVARAASWLVVSAAVPLGPVLASGLFA